SFAGPDRGGADAANPAAGRVRALVAHFPARRPRPARDPAGRRRPVRSEAKPSRRLVAHTRVVLPAPRRALSAPGRAASGGALAAVHLRRLRRRALARVIRSACAGRSALTLVA